MQFLLAGSGQLTDWWSTAAILPAAGVCKQSQACPMKTWSTQTCRRRNNGFTNCGRLSRYYLRMVMVFLSVITYCTSSSNTHGYQYLTSFCMKNIKQKKKNKTNLPHHNRGTLWEKRGSYQFHFRHVKMHLLYVFLKLAVSAITKRDLWVWRPRTGNSCTKTSSRVVLGRWTFVLTVTQLRFNAQR